LTNFLGVERNVTAASGAVFLVGLGEELWKKFLPKYLELLGASATGIGLFGTAEDFFDALYQYPGGWMADHWGRRRAFLAFLAAASTGYLIYFFSPSWPYLFLGLAFTMAWQSMASPAIFATIGDALSKERRAMGFTVQSILKRIPMVFSPLVGGAMIAAFGLRTGIRAGLAITLVFVGIAVPLLFLINLRVAPKDSVKLRGVWNAFHPTLKRLLVSDIAIRTCEGMADIFTVLYVTNVTSITIPEYCFALFPVAVVFANSFAWLVGAFVIGGLREIGEPSRKAMIVDFADAQTRARTVGLYYLVRSLSITPASAIGGLLWGIRPQIPFLGAGLIGIVGTFLFAATVDDKHAGRP